MITVRYKIKGRNFTWKGPSGNEYTFLYPRGADPVYEMPDEDAAIVLGWTHKRCCGQRSLPMFERVE